MLPSFALYTDSLPLTLGSASKGASHPGLIAVSAPLVCPVGVVPQPFTAISAVSTRLHLKLPCLPFPHLASSSLFTLTPHLQMSQFMDLLDMFVC